MKPLLRLTGQFIEGHPQNYSEAARLSMDRGRVPGTERTSVPTIVKQHPHISRQCVAEGDQLICPECRGIFYVLSIHPPEFHWASSCALGSLLTEALIAKGMNDTCSNHDISQVVE